MGGSPRLTASLRDLTPRQREVLERVAAGRTNYDIAQELGISLEGVKYHVSEILARLDVSSREDAASVWRAQRRPLARFGRLLAPLGGLGVRTSLIGAAVAVIGVVAGLLFLLSRGDNGPRDEVVGFVTAEPTVTAAPLIPASCSVSMPARVRPSLNPASGDGPVYTVIVGPNHVGEGIVEYAASADGYREPRGGQKFMVTLDPASLGEVTIRGRRLDGPGEVRFGDRLSPLLHLLVPAPVGSATPLPTDSTTWQRQDDGWYSFLTSIRIRTDSPGCYALDIAGPGSNHQEIVFWAIVTSAAPAASSYLDTYVPGSCPAHYARDVNPAFASAAGNGPVYAVLGPPYLAGQRTLLFHPPARYEGFEPGWGGQEVQFVVDPSYHEPITIDVHRIDGTGEARMVGPEHWVLLPPDVAPESGWMPMSKTADDWRSYLTSVTLPLGAQGCFQFDLTGPGLNESIIFWAEQETATPATSPTPTPGGSPQLCQSIPPGQPRPPIEWVAFVRWDGREYLLDGQGFGPSTPYFAANPSMAGRVLGEVRWNIRVVDPCYAEYDGSSSALEAGTVLYAMNGYREDFRILADTPHGWRVFESAWQDDARSADELLDIRDKVVAIELGIPDRVTGELAERRSVSQPAEVADLVDRLLSEPLTFVTTVPHFEEPRVRVTFQLVDGTSATRFWFAGPRAYSAGIPVSVAFVDELQRFVNGQ